MCRFDTRGLCGAACTDHNHVSADPRQLGFRQLRVHYAGVTLRRSWSPMDTWLSPFSSSFGNILACQRFPDVSRSWCQSRTNTTGVHMMGYDALTNVLMLLWCSYDRSLPNFGRVWGLLNRVSIGHQLQDSVTWALHKLPMVHMMTLSL